MCGYDKGVSLKCPSGDVKAACGVPSEGRSGGVGVGKCKFLEARAD